MECLCGFMISSRQTVIHSIFDGSGDLACRAPSVSDGSQRGRDEMAITTETRDDLARRLAWAGRVYSRVLGCEQGHEGLCEAAVGSQGCHRLC